MSSTRAQFWALMKKNFIVKRRSWVSTLFEVLLPTLVLLLLVLLHHLSPGDDFPENDQLLWQSNNDFTNATGAMLVRMNYYRSAIALVPASDFPEVDTLFTNYIQPAINRTQFDNLPDNLIHRFDTVEQFREYLDHPQYGRVDERPMFNAALMGERMYAGYNTPQDFQRDNIIPHFEYHLRMNASGDVAKPSYQTIPNTREQPIDILQPGFDFEDFVKYAANGFTALQQIQDLFLLNRTGAVQLPTFEAGAAMVMGNVLKYETQPFPTPAYSSDIFFRTVGESIGLFFTITFIWSVTRIVASLIEEKELKLREGMKIMGLETKWLILSWICTYLVIFFATCLAITVLVVPFLFAHSNYLIAFIFFFAFCLSTFSFGYLMSTIFDKSAVGSAFSAIIFLCIFFFHEGVKEVGSSRGAKLLASFSPAVALSLGARAFAQFEEGRIGIHMNNLFTQYDGYSAGDAIFMLIVDTIYLFLFGLYLEQVMPGEFGISKPWHFLCTSCFTKKSGDEQQNKRGLLDESIYDTLPQNEPYTKVEQPNKNDIGKEELQIRHLRREFAGNDGAKEPFVAVNDLSLDLYKDQIFTLLGHNGAGKTTVINMLTGMLPFTSGQVQVSGMDLASQLPQIRKNLGYCPQHDLLYPTLSVREHLELYCDIKSVNPDPVVREQMILDVIREVGLQKDDKEHALACSLSGGQKRKLSLALALLGGSKIVITDEPSSGMDVSAQRDLWKLLQKSKKGRVILLTTHSMEEAEIGDRIAILAHGRLQCVGSSHFLKQSYGVGYSIVVNKRSTQNTRQMFMAHNQNDDGLPLKLHPDCTTRSGTVVANYLCPKYPFLSVSSDAGNEIAFKARFEESAHFPALFDDLEASLDKLNIVSYNMSVTTLTEVFLTVGHGQEYVEGVTDRPVLKEGADDEALLQSNADLFSSTVPVGGLSQSEVAYGQYEPVNTASGGINSDSFDLTASAAEKKKHKPYFSLDQVYQGQQRFIVTGWPLVWIHIKALFMKRLHNSKRDLKSWIWQLLFPSLLLIVSLAIVKSQNQDEYPTRGIAPDLFYDPKQVSTMTYTDTGANARSLMAHIPYYRMEGVDVNSLPTLNADVDGGEEVIPIITPAMFAFNSHIDQRVYRKMTQRAQQQQEELNDMEQWTAQDAQHNHQLVSQPINLLQQLELLSNVLFNIDTLKQRQDQEEALREQFALNYQQLIHFYTLYSFDTTTVQQQHEQQELTDVVPIVRFQHWLLQHRKDNYRYLAFTINEYHTTPQYAGQTIFQGSIHFNTTAHDGLPMAINTLNNAILRASWAATQTTSLIEDSQQQEEQVMDDQTFAGLVNQLFTTLSTTIFGNEEAEEKKWKSLPTITLINSPLPRTANEKLFVSATIGLFIGLAMAFVPSTFVAFLVKERADKAKHLQIISGVSPVAYWVSTYMWDTLNFVFPFICAMIILWAFDIKVLMAGQYFWYTAAAFWLFQLSVAPFVYCFSFLFDSHNAAQNLTLLMGFLLSVILLLVSIIMAQLPSTKNIDRILRYVYRLLPPFTFGESLITITIQQSDFDADSLWKPMFYMMFDAVFYFALLLLIESWSTDKKFEKIGRVFSRFLSTHFKCCRPAKISRGGVILEDDSINNEEDIPIDCNEERDDDVLQEENRILYGECDNDEYGVVLKGLRKVYGSRAGQPPHVAVNNLYFAVKYGECFGFLGQNGAGKSTTIKCLVGDEVPSDNSGTALLGGFDLRQQSTEVRQVLGYVPQVDALLPLLTGRQCLELYARIKCVPEDKIEGLVNWMVDTIDIAHLADRPCGVYSGGNKRKLLCGQALIGNPRLLCLDEPSAGVDAASRRVLWSIISNNMKGRAVILVSHSMEETQALCHRIGIMTSGNLRACNSASQLQLKYGDGYQVITKAQDGCEQSLSDFFHRTYSGVEVVEQHGVNFTLKIPKIQGGARLTFKAIFTCLEQNKTSAGIESYSVSDTDLEHIFIGFVERDHKRRELLRAQIHQAQDAQHRGDQLTPEQTNLHFLGSPTPEDF